MLLYPEGQTNKGPGGSRGTLEPGAGSHVVCGRAEPAKGCTELRNASKLPVKPKLLRLSCCLQQRRSAPESDPVWLALFIRSTRGSGCGVPRASQALRKELGLELSANDETTRDVCQRGS